MDEEVWKPVTGNFTQPYEVSSEGRIRNARTGKVLKPSPSVKGYPQIGLAIAGRTRCIVLHKLIARAFHGERGSGLEVNHIDGDKWNSRPDNLEWVTHLENVRHYYDVLGGEPSHICRPGEDNGNARLTRSQVEEIRLLLVDGDISQSDIARHYGVSSKTINHISTGRRWKLQT
jgi:hypothetical protein